MSFLSKLGKIGMAVAPFAAMAIPGVGPAVGGLLHGALGAGGGGMLTNLLGGAGAALNGASQASASNRGTTIEAKLAEQQQREQQRRDSGDLQQQYQNEQVNRETEGRNAANDAFKGILRAEYIKGRTGYTPATLHGQQLASFGFGPKASTAAEIEAATKFGHEKMDRLNSGNTITMPTAPDAPTPFTIDPNLLKAGTFEKIAGILGPGLGMFGQLAQLQQQQNGQATTPPYVAPQGGGMNPNLLRNATF